MLPPMISCYNFYAMQSLFFAIIAELHCTVNMPIAINKRPRAENHTWSAFTCNTQGQSQ